jgi:hypothetical protein
MDRDCAARPSGIFAVDRVANHVKEAAERLLAYRHHHRRAGVFNLAPAREAGGVLERNSAHAAKANAAPPQARTLRRPTFVLSALRSRQLLALKVDVDDRPDDLFYFSFHKSFLFYFYAAIASIPPVISLTSR